MAKLDDYLEYEYFKSRRDDAYKPSFLKKIKITYNEHYEDLVAPDSIDSGNYKGMDPEDAAQDALYETVESFMPQWYPYSNRELEFWYFASGAIGDEADLKALDKHARESLYEWVRTEV